MRSLINMFYTIKLLNSSSLKKINKLFDQGDFSSGLFSGTEHVPDIKNNNEMINDNCYNECSNLVATAIEKSSDFQEITILRKCSNFIFSEYDEGKFYKEHYDDCIMSPNCRTDYSVTLFLSDKDSYDGGELSLNVGNANIDYKLESGEALIYPTGIKHQVKPVKSGKRRVCVFWIESAIQNMIIRDCVSKMAQMFIEKSDKIQNFEEEIWNDIYSVFLSLKRNYANYDSIF